jgi:hypothetical protein
MPDASFLTEKFSVFGFEFQNWMVIVAAGLVFYAVFVSLKKSGGNSP